MSQFIMNFLSLIWSCNFSSPNSPNWFVCNNNWKIKFCEAYICEIIFNFLRNNKKKLTREKPIKKIFSIGSLNCLDTMLYGSLVFRLTFCLVLLGQVIVIGLVFARQRHKGQCYIANVEQYNFRHFSDTLVLRISSKMLTPRHLYKKSYGI